MSVIAEVNERNGVSEVEEYVTWDNTMVLDFYSDKDLINHVTPDNLSIGSRVNFAVSWKNDFLPDFPVAFTVTDCTIQSLHSKEKFEIVSENCLSDLVSTRRLSDRFSPVQVGFSYQSFAFNSNGGEHEMSLQCKVEFCLREKKSFLCDSQSDHGKNRACPIEYSP